MLLFSLVIPVYRVEKYICKCLLSCLQQEGINPAEYEIIVVDDGSPDDSIKIARGIVLNYPNNNVRIIQRSNGGLSAARNTGLLHVNGQYVWFVDSDDWIEKNSLSLLKQKLLQVGMVDILSFKHKTVYGEKVIPVPVKSGDYAGDGFTFLCRNNFLSACERIYRLSFLQENDLQFSEGYLWEDAQFNIRALSICKTHYYYDVSLYYYVRRNGSITTSGISEIMEKSRFYLIDSVYQYLMPRKLTVKQRRIVNQKLSNILIAAIVGIGELPISQRTLYYKMYESRKNFYLSLLDETGIWNLKFLGFLLRISFGMTQSILSFRMKKAIGNM